MEDCSGETIPAKNEPSRKDGAPRRLLIPPGQSPDQNGLDGGSERNEVAAQRVPAVVRDPIGELISAVERAEQRLDRRNSFARPRRFPWAPDEDVEVLENEIAAMYERYR